SKIKDFAIFLAAPDSGEKTLPTEIISPEFLSHPPYAIRGHVTGKGEVKARYEYHPVSQGKPRQCPITMDWSDVRKSSEFTRKLPESHPDCGPFAFEIRAWDLGSDDTKEVAEHFDIAKGNIRKSIRAHKGISVYRDGILVLP